VVSDLRERLEELAEAAADHGRTPGPEAARRRGRQRRWRLAAGRSALVALVLFGVVVAGNRLAGPAGPPAAAPTTRPAEVTASTRSKVTASTRSIPSGSYPPEPGEILRPVGAPPGQFGEDLVWDMGSELTRCPGGDPDAPKVLLAWGTAGDRTWAEMAKPPRPGERLICWAVGDYQADGSQGVGTRQDPVRPLRLSGNHRPGWVTGAVTARAARVRVLFDAGIAPLDLVPIRAASRSPVKFFSGSYRQPAQGAGAASPVVGLVAYDRAGRRIVECQNRSGSAGDRCG
jgi:hypothetical protein